MRAAGIKSRCLNWFGGYQLRSTPAGFIPALHINTCVFRLLALILSDARCQWFLWFTTGIINISLSTIKISIGSLCPKFSVQRSKPKPLCRRCSYASKWKLQLNQPQSNKALHPTAYSLRFGRSSLRSGFRRRVSLVVIRQVLAPLCARILLYPCPSALNCG